MPIDAETSALTGGIDGQSLLLAIDFAGGWLLVGLLICFASDLTGNDGTGFTTAGGIV